MLQAEVSDVKAFIYSTVGSHSWFVRPNKVRMLFHNYFGGIPILHYSRTDYGSLGGNDGVLN